MALKLIGLSGSLRRDSFNTRLLLAAQSQCSSRVTLDLHSIAAIPLYNFDDEEANGIPAAVAELKSAIAEADGLVIASPEYNSSVPGVLKNAIDWLSRPTADIGRVFGGLPVAITGATPGSFGTVSAQNAWLPVMRSLGATVWSGSRLLVPHAAQLFDVDGKLIDVKMNRRLEDFIAGFAEFANSKH